ncbi:hypothetical protein PG984_002687 [Apiospora sp. TS-2023a]
MGDPFVTPDPSQGTRVPRQERSGMYELHAIRPPWERNILILNVQWNPGPDPRDVSAELAGGGPAGPSTRAVNKSNAGRLEQGLVGMSVVHHNDHESNPGHRQSVTSSNSKERDATHESPPDTPFICLADQPYNTGAGLSGGFWTLTYEYLYSLERDLRESSASDTSDPTLAPPLKRQRMSQCGMVSARAARSHFERLMGSDGIVWDDQIPDRAVTVTHDEMSKLVEATRMFEYFEVDWETLAELAAVEWSVAKAAFAS